MCQNEHLLVLQGVPNQDIKMAALSLTEEMFSIIQGYSYVESMKYISPGSDLPEGMFSSLEHAQNYELDTRLTYKGYQRKKGAKRKTTINPTMIYTMFSMLRRTLLNRLEGIWFNGLMIINRSLNTKPY